MSSILPLMIYCAFIAMLCACSIGANGVSIGTPNGPPRIPQAAPSAGATVTPTKFDNYNLSVDGNNINIANAGTYSTQDKTARWLIGGENGLLPAGSWFVDLGVLFVRTIGSSDLISSDIKTISITLYRSNGIITTGYLATRSAPFNDDLDAALSNGVLTVKLNTNLTEPGRSSFITVQGSVAARIQ